MKIVLFVQFLYLKVVLLLLFNNIYFYFEKVKKKHVYVFYVRVSWALKFKFLKKSVKIKNILCKSSYLKVGFYFECFVKIFILFLKSKKKNMYVCIINNENIGFDGYIGT